MVSFEIFVKAMPPSLSELKDLPSFCFAFKIPDDRAVTNTYVLVAIFVEDENFRCTGFPADCRTIVRKSNVLFGLRHQKFEH